MPRILIVEDSEKLAQGLRTNLEFDGHEVRLVHDGTRGLEAALDGWAELIILDLMLPGMDGYALLRAARERGLRAPVLILTALGEEAEKVRGFRFGEIEVHTAAHIVTRGGATVNLRPREYDLLVALAKRLGDVVSRAELLRDVWGYGDDVVTRTVDTHVAELRRKLEDDPARPRWIVTVPRAGYRLVRSDAATAR